MRKYATIYLTVTVLPESAGVSWCANFQKGINAYEKGDLINALYEC
jgi:hypothetical protein